MKKYLFYLLFSIFLLFGTNISYAGFNHECGITTDNELKCWGYNYYGQTNVPTGYIWKNVSAKFFHTCGITTDNELKCWGYNNFGQSNVPTGYTWKNVSTGYFHTCGITTEDELKCWGNNNYLQTNVPTGYTWKNISIGYYHTCGITSDDELKCWGSNSHGELNVPNGFNWNQISLGDYHTCGLTTGNELKCWGYNSYGESNVPVGHTWKYITTGNNHTCGLTIDNELKCWGYNRYLQSDVPTGYIWEQVNLGEYHTCGITNSNELKCWGYNGFGETNVPEGYTWKQSIVGYYYTCGITITGDELKCWGDGGHGQTNVPAGYTWLSFGNTQTQDSFNVSIGNLNQYIISPLLEQEEVTLGSKIGKFQSGSGVILSANVVNDSGDKIRLAFDIYRFGNDFPIETYYSNGGNYVDISFDTLETTIPYLGAGDYYWKVRVENDKGNTSQAVDFGTDNAWEIDYSLYEGFEPYPYGFSFYNKGPADGVLDGGVYGIYGLAKWKKDGNKWDIFESAFDLSSFNNNPDKIYDAFEIVGLNKDDAMQGGNCYGMAVSSLLQYTKSGALFLENNHSDFSQAVGTGSIWNNITEPSTIKENNITKWNEYNKILKTIYALQLSQFSTHQANADTFATTTNGNEILSKFNNNPDKNYILSFGGINKVKKEFLGAIWYENSYVGHTVVPYKVEGNKIYFWDNNVQYPAKDLNLAYNQYIEVNSDGTWEPLPLYGWKEFNELSLVDIDDIINDGNKSTPIGFNDTDTNYTLSGSADLYVTDSIGRISGYLSGGIREEIPGVKVIRPLNATLTGAIENTWKQIYLPQKQDLSVKISGDTEELYDLMIAGGDYYTKISGVETNSGQIDTFNITRENLQIDFDDNKIGNYNLLVDNFQNSGTGTIYVDNVISNINPQQYNINWQEVINNTNNAVNYQIDINSDGIYDVNTNFSPIYQDNTTPTTTHTISGNLNTNTTNSYIENVTIDLNSIDNENGTGVDKIYYAIGTDTGSLVYVEYTEPVLLNGVGDYTLNYYSKDKFGNTEEVKTTNFSLTEKPETYAGNISGYVYDDSNKNGVQDNGEKYMAGWKICIDKNNNNDCEENIEPFNVTNNDGYYEFDSLITGTYKILEIPHQNWIIINPTDGKYIINLLNGQRVEQKNFGNFKIKGGKN
ncbi:MAG: SdrD B-like domain-containing protein [Candidatus Gracilibacteria bacterium]|nr:SdrD B-like domain-containing protein [Candidatus Gracilibacteria bacterium]